MKEDFLYDKMQERIQQNAYRQLSLPAAKIDFCSNDYLGVVVNRMLESRMGAGPSKAYSHGSTGSRLLAGNYRLIEETEQSIARFHDTEAALIFNSGYDANIGLLSCIAQKHDTILYDFLCHASIRDGVRLSLAQSWSFRHNDLHDLEKKLQQATGNIFVVTESVFSMDGDTAALVPISDLCVAYHARLIVDEAHATGVIGTAGEGLVQQLRLQSKCFARIHTFGKALGCHGAAVVGSELLRNYLINFCRPFIYTTALPESATVAIKHAYDIIPLLNAERTRLQSLVRQFQTAPLRYSRLISETAIQGIIVPGNSAVKELAQRLQQKHLDVRPILYPTVPKGSERLRIVLHAFNTTDDVRLLAEALAT